jgi:hypothetical protein
MPATPRAAAPPRLRRANWWRQQGDGDLTRQRAQWHNTAPSTRALTLSAIKPAPAATR